MNQKIMILNIVKVNNYSIIKYCMKPIGNSQYMKGLIVMDEVSDNVKLFELPDKLIGKWIEVKIDCQQLKNNKVKQKIGEYLIYKYGL